MNQTRGIDWPDGAQCAVAFTFDVDAESPLLAVRPELAGRMTTMSQQAYGPEVGVPRLLRVLADCEVRSTFFVPGYTARRYPQTIAAIAAAGHELAHHGYLHEPLAGKPRRRKPPCWTRAWPPSATWPG